MIKQGNAPTPSILSAIRKMQELLTYKEKMKWVGMMGLALLVSIFESATAFTLVVFTQLLTDSNVSQSSLRYFGIVGELPFDKIIVYITIAVGILYLIKTLITIITISFQNFSIQLMSYTFKRKLLIRYAQIDYGIYLTRDAAFGLQIVNVDTEQVFTIGMTGIAEIASETIIFISLVGMIVYLNPTLAMIVFIIILVLFLIITKFLLPYFYQWGQKLRQAQLNVKKTLIHFFHGFKEIILLNKKDYFVNDHYIHSKQASNIRAIHLVTNAIPRMIMEMLFVGVFIFITLYLLLIRDETSQQLMGLLSGYLYVGFRLMPGLNRIITRLNNVKSVIPSIERVHKEYTTDVSNNHYHDISEFTFEQSIAFKNVSFQHLNTEKETLLDVNLKIRRGERIGIIGETGSGKSTLIDLLLGLLSPTSGDILIDNKYPVNSIQWHSKIGYVPQVIYLVDNSIETNIVFGNHVTNQDNLNRTIDLAQLRALIDSLPQGTKTVVGERGVKLSGGERQRIAIARALYTNPDVLIFDEATSSLDNETEERLMKTIEAISRNHTVIMVAHRLTTLKDCDRIIRIGKGRITEITTYNNIIT